MHPAVDTGELLAVLVTPGDEQSRAHVGALAAQIQKAMGDAVAVALVDQGYAGDKPVSGLHFLTFGMLMRSRWLALTRHSS